MQRPNNPFTMFDTDSFYNIYFIFHPDDIDIVRHLANQLTVRDVSCWFDEKEFGETEDGKRQLMGGILRSHTVAMVLTPNSAESQLCNELIEFAVTNSKRFVSLIVDEDIVADVHPAIAENPYVFFREHDEFEEGIANLIRLMPPDEHLKLHTELLVAANTWDLEQRTKDLLLPQGRVEQARQWLADGAQQLPKPSQLQVEFIHASRRQKPAKRRGISRNAALASLAVLLAVVLFSLLSNLSVSQVAATETAEFHATSEVLTQVARSAAVTAEKNSAANVLAGIAATAASNAREFRQTAEAAAQKATSQAAITLTAGADTRAQAARERATEISRIDTAFAAQSVMQAAEAALESADFELALALAWDAAQTLTEPSAALDTLRRIATLHPKLTLSDVSTMAVNPEGIQFAIVPRSFDKVQVYDALTGSLDYEIEDFADAISALAYSRDGTYLITAAQDGEVVIRSSENGEATHRLQGHSGAVTAIAMYASGDKMVTAGQDPLLISWDINSGEELANYADGAPLSDLLVTADDSRVIAWSNEGGKSVMAQWSAETLDLLTEDTGGRVYLGYDQSGRSAYSGGRSLPAYAGDPNTGDLIFWDLTTGQQKTRLTQGFNWSILSGSDISSATDSLLFIAIDDSVALLGVQNSSGGQRAVLVSSEDGTVLRTFENDLAASLTSADFLNAQTVLSATRDKRLLLWSLEDGRLIRDVGIASRPLQGLRVSADGKTATSQATDGTVSLWHIDQSSAGLLRELDGFADDAAINQSGTALLIKSATKSETSSHLQDITSGENLLEIDRSHAVDMNSSGSHFAVYDEGEGEIILYDAENGEQLSSWLIEAGDDINLHIAPTGDLVLINRGSGSLLSLRPETAPQQLNSGNLGPAAQISFAADGDRFLTVHAGRALLWDGASPEPMQVFALGLPPDFPLREQFRAALNAAGDTLYFFVQLDDKLAGLTEITLDGGSLRRQTFINVEYGDLSADGTYLLLSFVDHSVQIVETASGEAVQRFASVGHAINKLSYQARTNRLYAGAEDGSLLILDVSTGAISQRFAHPSAVIDFRVSQSAELVLTRDSRGVLRLWRVESDDQLLRRIEADFAPRDLSCAEREQYHALPLCE